MTFCFETYLEFCLLWFSARNSDLRNVKRDTVQFSKTLGSKMNSSYSMADMSNTLRENFFPFPIHLICIQVHLRGRRTLKESIFHHFFSSFRKTFIAFRIVKLHAAQNSLSLLPLLSPLPIDYVFFMCTLIICRSHSSLSLLSFCVCLSWPFPPNTEKTRKGAFALCTRFWARTSPSSSQLPPSPPFDLWRRIARPSAVGAEARG